MSTAAAAAADGLILTGTQPVISKKSQEIRDPHSTREPQDLKTLWALQISIANPPETLSSPESLGYLGTGSDGVVNAACLSRRSSRGLPSLSDGVVNRLTLPDFHAGDHGVSPSHSDVVVNAACLSRQSSWIRPISGISGFQKMFLSCPLV